MNWTVVSHVSTQPLISLCFLISPLLWWTCLRGNLKAKWEHGDVFFVFLLGFCWIFGTLRNKKMKIKPKEKFQHSPDLQTLSTFILAIYLDADVWNFTHSFVCSVNTYVASSAGLSAPERWEKIWQKETGKEKDTEWIKDGMNNKEKIEV